MENKKETKFDFYKQKARDAYFKGDMKKAEYYKRKAYGEN